MVLYIVEHCRSRSDVIHQQQVLKEVLNADLTG